MAFIVLPSSPAIAKGLSTSDAGKASCQGTLGGGKLSQTELNETCQEYINSLEDDSGNSSDPPANELIYEIIRGIVLILLGAVIGTLITRKQQSIKKKRG